MSHVVEPCPNLATVCLLHILQIPTLPVLPGAAAGQGLQAEHGTARLPGAVVVPQDIGLMDLKLLAGLQELAHTQQYFFWLHQRQRRQASQEGSGMNHS